MKTHNSSFPFLYFCVQIMFSIIFVSGLNLVTYLDWTPIFEWCGDRCGSKNRHKIDVMYLEEIGLC